MMKTLYSILIGGSILLTGGVAHAQLTPTQPASGSAEADEASRVLEIRGGEVILNGERLPAANIPEGLDLRGIDMSFQFSGPVIPVVEIDGEVYVVADNRMMLLEETGRNESQAYFLAEPQLIDNDDEQGEVLRRRQQPVEDLVQAGQEAYLHQLSNRDQSLYNQIRQEQQLEHETHLIADRIRRTENDSELVSLEGQLRLKLEQSFELKQQIRANEIQRAEEQIEVLRDLLERRASRKQQIIERRFLELTRKNTQ